MVGELPDLTKIGQAALELPQTLMSMEIRQASEKMNTLSSSVQGMIANVPSLPVIGQGLPALPGLPGLPGANTGAGAATGGSNTPRSTAVNRAATRKKGSYLEA